jgi:hypothetical protein
MAPMSRVDRDVMDAIYISACFLIFLLFSANICRVGRACAALANVVAVLEKRRRHPGRQTICLSNLLMRLKPAEALWLANTVGDTSQNGSVCWIGRRQPRNLSIWRRFNDVAVGSRIALASLSVDVGS